MGTSSELSAAEDARRQAEGLRRLSRVSARLLQPGEPAELAHELFAQLGGHVGADLFFHFHYEPTEERPLILEAAEGVSDEVRRTFARLQLGEDVCGQTALRREPSYVPDLQSRSDPATSRLAAAGVRAYLCTPLLSFDRLVGTLSFGSRVRDRFEADEIDLLRTASYQLALALDRRRGERELREQKEGLRLALEASDASEALYRAIAKNLPRGAVFVVDHDLRYRLADGQALAAVGLAPPDLEGRTVFEASPPHVVAQAVEDYRCALAGRAFGHEHTQDGRHFVTEGVPLLAADGTVLAALAISYDITDRKRAEAALRESESFHRQILDSIPGMVFTNTPDGACDYVSEPWVRFTGVPAAGQLGDGWLQVLHPDDRARAFAAWREAVDTHGRYDVEYRVRRADGGYEWFKVRGQALRDARGAVARWFGVATNIEDLKRAEAALVARERELQTLTDNSPEVLSRFDRDLRHVFVNAAVERATGLPRHAFLGKTNREMGMPAALCDEWEACLHTVFREARPQTIEFAFPSPDGTRHFVGHFVPELGPDGVVEYALGTTHDVTERKRIEEALRDADRRKDEFLATLAHELRNPLASLRSGLEVLRRVGPMEPAPLRARETMERQLGHLVRLVDDLLDVSRIRSGKVVVERACITMQSVIEHALETSHPLIAAGAHRLELDVPETPLWVEGDLTRLAQVVSNLLNNAAKYTAASGRIRLRLAAEGGEVVVRVADDGAGIEPDMLPRIFELFGQVEHSLPQAQGGLGIGLSLAKQLIELHGGTLTAHSEGRGRGSTFTVRLAHAAPAAAAVAVGSVRPDGALVADGGTRARRVLVVDDNVDGAETLAMLLELSGHEVAVAHNGPSALDLARAHGPEVVFLDIGLPEMDGYEVARRLRSDPTTARATLVAVTGWGSLEDKRRSAAAGFDVHLTKPVEAEAIDAVLSTRAPLPAG